MQPPGFIWRRGLLGPRIVHLAWRRGLHMIVRLHGQRVTCIPAVCGQHAVLHMPEVADTARCPACAEWATNWTRKITP